MGKNRHHIDTSLDTSLKKKLGNSLFPDTLRGKKYQRPENFLGLSNERLGSFEAWKTLLEKYLDTENPDYLIEAIRENNGLLQGIGRRFRSEELGIVDKPSDPIYVDGYTIVWETIHWWQKLHGFLGSSKKEKEIIVELLRNQGKTEIANRLAQEKKIESEEAKKYLTKIGSYALVYSRQKELRILSGDGFIHVIPEEEGTKPYLEYESPHNFIEYWNRVETAFKTKKKRYTTIHKSRIDELEDDDSKYRAIQYERQKGGSKVRDIKNIIKDRLGDEISGIEIYKRFNLEHVGTITASYIAWKHEKDCPVCKKEKRKNKKVGYKTTLRRYKKALKETNQPNTLHPTK